jgi:two-component system NarL family response regulator
MKSKTRILLADDHLVVRMGLALMIGRQPDMQLVGEAENGEEAVRLVGELFPDVTIMDLQMPVMDGATATQKIIAENPAAKVLILTTFGATADAARALDEGALSAISKDSAQDRLLTAIRTTAMGESVIDDDIRASAETYRSAPKLSARQIEILDYASRGLENAEIARLLGISTDGVKKHLKLIYTALGASTRAEASTLAIRLGLLH